MRFESPYILNFLFILPLIVVVFIVFKKRAQLQLKKALGNKYLPYLTSSVSPKKRKWKLILELVAVSFFIIALARPQSSDGTIKVKNQGIEIMILFDVSNSMLAEDIRPNRLEFAKLEARRFVDASPGDRFGLVAFAGSAALVSPMTTDKNAVRLFIDSLDINSVSTQGTDFNRAFAQARESFLRGSMHDEESAITRAIVVISDGEDHDSAYKEEVAALRNENIFIFTLAVGTDQGAAIPLKDQQGTLRGYRRDEAGQVIMSRVSGETLKEIAKQGGGTFYHLDYAGAAIKSIRENINRLQQAQFEDGEIRSYKEMFQVFLIFGLIIAIIELLLGERSGPGRVWKGRFEVSES